MELGNNLKVLVVGGGGREHAICWKLAQSALVHKIFCAPGNGGTAKEAKTSNIDIAVMDFDKLTAFAKKESIDLIVVGPDDPIAAGAVDHFKAAGLRAFGPNKDAAQLEASKTYSKNFMVQNRIPTARFMVCDSLQEGLHAVKEHPWARVIKADGLALGKGVFVCDDEEQAVQALHAIFREKRFGEAGNRVVLEERLVGEELSLLLFCDGKRLVEMPASQDHKRRFDGDKGPNTGGMGAYSPVDLYVQCRDEIQSQVLLPLRKALEARSLDYQGILFIGILVESRELEDGTRHYQPYVLEFNARFGDPETQTLLPLLKSDLLPILWSCTNGKLGELDIEWRKQSSCCVVAAADTYPESSSKGEQISIGTLNPETFVFHAGTALHSDKVVTNGGRVLAVTGLDGTMSGAAEKSYTGLSQISFKGIAYRKDIARRASTGCLSR